MDNKNKKMTITLNSATFSAWNKLKNECGYQLKTHNAFTLYMIKKVRAIITKDIKKLLLCNTEDEAYTGAPGSSGTSNPLLPDSGQGVGIEEEAVTNTGVSPCSPNFKEEENLEIDVVNTTQHRRPESPTPPIILECEDTEQHEIENSITDFGKIYIPFHID